MKRNDWLVRRKLVIESSHLLPPSFDADELPTELTNIRCQAEDSTTLAEDMDALHFGTEEMVR